MPLSACRIRLAGKTDHPVKELQRSCRFCQTARVLLLAFCPQEHVHAEPVRRHICGSLAHLDDASLEASNLLERFDWYLYTNKITKTV